MKFIKKIMPVMLAVMLCFTALPTSVSAATKKVSAGATTTVSFGINKGFGGDGNVAVSDPNGIVSSVKVSGSGLGSAQFNGTRFAFSSSDEIKGGSISVSVTISSKAKAGDSCTVSVSGYRYVDADDNMVDSSLGSHKIIVKGEDKPQDDDKEPTKPNKPSKPDKEESKPSKPSKPNKEESTPNKEESKPSTSDKNNTVDKVVDQTDYTELEKQIEIAEGLKKDGYTKESWANLMEALDAARNAVGCGDQATVDAAAKALATAIEGLEKVDYSKLQAAIDEANALIASDELGDLWNKLFNLLLGADGLLVSDDQAAVDAAADEINALLEQIKALLLGDEEVVDAEPEGEYCNIPIHKIWPILFFISLLVNIVLVVLLVGSKNKKQGKTRKADDTPMVDYDISDDDK